MLLIRDMFKYTTGYLMLLFQSLNKHVKSGEKDEIPRSISFHTKLKNKGKW
jgi:hypothetical protein